MDSAFELVGRHGTYQKILLFFIIPSSSISFFLSIGFPFLTSIPLLLCRAKTSNPYDMTLGEYITCPIDICERTNQFDVIKDETGFDNISYKFDLFCDYKYYIHLIAAFYFVGNILSTIVLSPLPDKYGREKIYKILLFLSSIIYINLIFCDDIHYLLVLYFLSGLVSYYGVMSALLATEFLKKDIYGRVLSIMNACNPIAGILLGLFYTYVNSFTILFSIISGLSLIKFFFSLYYIIESPRWLFINHREIKCLETFSKIAEINGTKEKFNKFIMDNSFSKINVSLGMIRKHKKYSIFDILKKKSQRNSILLISFLWLMVGVCFFGIFLNLDAFKGSMIHKGIIFFLAECISKLASGFIADRIGRVKALQIYSFIGAVSLLLYELIGNDSWFNIYALLICSFGYSGNYNVIYIYTGELFPTNIRSTVFGFCYFMFQVGGLLVPLLNTLIYDLGIYIGFLGLLIVVLGFMLKETLECDIHDHIELSSSESDKDDADIYLPLIQKS